MTNTAVVPSVPELCQWPAIRYDFRGLAMCSFCSVAVLISSIVTQSGISVHYSIASR